jgi:Ser/Thr protein kinase RdoA (MazF antagonist)
LTPERVLDAVEAAGLRSNPVCYPLNSFENRVYEVELETGERVVAKFYRPGRWSEAQILEEHSFLAELDAAEAPVCPMRAFPDGSTLKQIAGIWYCLANRRGGRAPDELDARLAERLGMLVGRLHAVGAERDAGPRRPLDAEHFVRRSVAWLAEHDTIPGPFAERYRDAALEIAELAERAMQGVVTQRIHADLHLGNVLLRDGQLRVLDFDDMASGPPVQDLWLALPGRDEETARLRESFLAGYERFRLFDRSTLRLIEPLRGLRLVRYAAWLARRWHDPAFRQGWPHFGTGDYWEAETRDLEEQLAAIRRVAGAGTDAVAAAQAALQPEELLDNKDYFFDWEDD